MADVRPDDLDRLLAEAVSAPGPCPDENVLAALGEGRLAETQRDAVLAHVASCPACAWVAEGLAEAAPNAAPPAEVRRSPALRLLPWAAAALVLVAVGAWWLASRPSSPEPLEPADTGRFLADAAALLAKEVPERFAGFTPLSRAELRLQPVDPKRGDAPVALPSGRIVDVRPRLSWPSVPAARSYEVVLLGRGGELWRRRVERATRDAEHFAWPADAPALTSDESYVWTVTADDPHGTRSERAIQVVSAEEIAAWRAALADVEARVPAPGRHLLVAHLALRKSLLTEAFDALARYGEPRPGDEIGEQTRAQVGSLLAR